MTRFDVNCVDTLGNRHTVQIVRQVFDPSGGEILVGSDGRQYRRRPDRTEGVELLYDPADDPSVTAPRRDH